MSEPASPDRARLILVATPIGNLDDMSPRAVEALRGADAIAAEDTRHSGRLLERFSIPRPPVFFSCHEHNEAAGAERIAGLLGEGKSVALISDAGMPGLSDPGYRVVRAALEAGFDVSAVPGPNAAVMALAISGLSAASFTFKGFAPRKSGQRQRFLEMEAESPHTLVFYESPHRVGAFLKDAAEVLGARQGAVCLELTKLYERVARGSLPELAEAFADKKVKGEATIVIAGLSKQELKALAKERGA